MFGQLGFFAVRSKEKAPLAIERFTTEAARLLGVIEGRLQQTEYLAGDDYSIADIIAYPWTVVAKTFLKEPLSEAWRNKPSVERWLNEVGSRPAVIRGMDVPKG